MAKQLPYGRFYGKNGSMVGRRGVGGQVYINEKGKDPTNPRTQAQMSVRGRMALSAKVNSMLGVLGSQVLMANGLSASRRGQLTKMIFAATSVDLLGNVSLSTNLPLVKSPDLYANLDATVSIARADRDHSGSFRCVFTNSEADASSYLRLVGVLMVYNKTKDQWQSQALTLAPAGGNITIFSPSTGVPDTDEYFCYAYVMGVKPKAGSALALQGLTGDADSIDMAIAAAAVSGDLAYTQLIGASAHDVSA